MLLGGLLLRRVTLARLGLGALVAVPVAYLADGAARIVHRPVAGIALAALAALLLALGGARRTRSLRGVEILAATRRSSKPGRLRLAGQPVPAGDEARHFKILGSAGAGKTTAVRALIEDARERGDCVVVADPDGVYRDAFCDETRSDRVLHATDPSACGWGLAEEWRDARDGDALARALLPHRWARETSARVLARALLGDLITELARAGCCTFATLYELLTRADRDALRPWVTGTTAATLLLPEHARLCVEVRASASAELLPLSSLAAVGPRPALGIRNFVRERPAATLFLPYRVDECATTQSLVPLWLHLAMYEALADRAATRRIWFAAEELDALGPIEGLIDALRRLGARAGSAILGTSDVRSLETRYGRAGSQALLESCGSTLVLRCGGIADGGLAQVASQLIGDREVERVQESRALEGPFGRRARTRTQTRIRAIERAVWPIELEYLAPGTGFLKFASTPAWLRLVEPFADVHTPAFTQRFL